MGSTTYLTYRDKRASVTRVQNGQSHLDDTVTEETLSNARSLGLESLFQRYQDLGMDSELLELVRENSAEKRFYPDSYIMIQDEFGEVVAYMEVREVERFMTAGKFAGLQLLKKLGIKNPLFEVKREGKNLLTQLLTLGGASLYRHGEEFEIQRLYISPKIQSSHERNFLWEEVMSVWLKENYLDRYPQSVFWALATDESHRRYHVNEFGMDERAVFQKNFAANEKKAAEKKTTGKTESENNKIDLAFLLASSGADMAKNIEQGVRRRRQETMGKIWADFPDSEIRP